MKQEEQFLSFLDNHKGILYKVANAYCPGLEDRKDLLQEMTIQLWKSFHNYNNQYSYSTWAYRIALNVAISFYRKESRRKQLFQAVPDDILYFIDTGKAEAMEEDIGFLMKFITGLREIDKGLVLLYLEEKPYKEIASIMGLSESNVATRIGRIKTGLKIKFSNLKNQ